jgi:hypothetical protein
VKKAERGAEPVADGGLGDEDRNGNEARALLLLDVVALATVPGF